MLILTLITLAMVLPATTCLAESVEHCSGEVQTASGMAEYNYSLSFSTGVQQPGADAPTLTTSEGREEMTAYLTLNTDELNKSYEITDSKGIVLSDNTKENLLDFFKKHGPENKYSIKTKAALANAKSWQYTSELVILREVTTIFNYEHFYNVETDNNFEHELTSGEGVEPNINHRISIYRRTLRTAHTTNGIYSETLKVELVTEDAELQVLCGTNRPRKSLWKKLFR